MQWEKKNFCLDLKIVHPDLLQFNERWFRLVIVWTWCSGTNIRFAFNKPNKYFICIVRMMHSLKKVIWDFFLGTRRPLGGMLVTSTPQLEKFLAEGFYLHSLWPFGAPPGKPGTPPVPSFWLRALFLEDFSLETLN